MKQENSKPLLLGTNEQHPGHLNSVNIMNLTTENFLTFGTLPTHTVNVNELKVGMNS